MKNKKALENTLLAVIGIGLVTTAVILLSKRNKSETKDPAEGRRVTSYDDYDEDYTGLHAFSETGVLL